jgi:hypothetical protein
LQFVAKDEIKLLGKVREEYDPFIAVVTRVVDRWRHTSFIANRAVHTLIFDLPQRSDERFIGVFKT